MKKLALIFCFVLLSFGSMACEEIEKCDIADTQCVKECTSQCANDDTHCVENCVDLSTANGESQEADLSNLAGLIPEEILMIIFALLKSGVI